MENNIFGLFSEVRSAVPMYAFACSLQHPPYCVRPVSTEFVVMYVVSEALQACSTRSAGSAPRDGGGAPGGGARGGAADALHAGEHERRGWRVWLGSWRRRDSGGQRADAVAAAAASASAALDQASLCCVHPITCGMPACLFACNSALAQISGRAASAPAYSGGPSRFTQHGACASHPVRTASLPCL